MARTISLDSLRTEIYNRGEWDSTYIPSAELTSYINSSIADLYDLILSVNQDYYLSSETISVVSGTNSYSLPTTFYKMRGIDVLKTDGDYVRIEPFVWEDRNLYSDNESDREAVRYRIMGSQLILAPTPAWSGTLRIWYIPAPVLLVNSTDTLDGVSGWDEYVIADCCIKCAAKEESSATIFQQQKAGAALRIQRMAASRDAANNDCIRDSRIDFVDRTRPWLRLPRP